MTDLPDEEPGWAQEELYGFTRVTEHVAHAFNVVDPEVLRVSGRHGPGVATARAVAIRLCRERGAMRLEVAKFFRISPEGLDYGQNRLNGELKLNARLRRVLDKLRSNLK